MLRRIPTIRPMGIESFFFSIHFRLSFYEDLKDSLALLELAFWKSKITEQFSQSNILLTTEMKMRCRTESVTMVNIIVPNVVSFLTDLDDSNCAVDEWSDEDDGDEEDDDGDWSNEDDGDQDNGDDGDQEDDDNYDEVNDDLENEDDGDQEGGDNNDEVKRRRVAV